MLPLATWGRTDCWGPEGRQGEEAVTAIQVQGDGSGR